MPPALTSTARAARLLRLYGWLTLIVLAVLLVAFGWPALREGQAVSPRNFDYLAVGIPAAALLFFAANKLSSGRQGNRYFAAALCVLMMFFFPIGTVLGARFSSRRASVVAIAVVASLLSLLQCGIFAFIVMLSAWNAEARSQAWFSLAAVAVAGTGLVWWYVAAKLSRHKLQA